MPGRDDDDRLKPAATLRECLAVTTTAADAGRYIS